MKHQRALLEGSFGAPVSSFGAPADGRAAPGLKQRVLDLVPQEDLAAYVARRDEGPVGVAADRHEIAGVVELQRRLRFGRALLLAAVGGGAGLRREPYVELPPRHCQQHRAVSRQR